MKPSILAKNRVFQINRECENSETITQEKHLFAFACKTCILLMAFIMSNYAEAQDNKTSYFLYSGNKGLAPQSCLYKVDNMTRDEFSSAYLGFGYNKSHKIGAFEIILPPGIHTFEIVLNDKGVSSKPKNIVAKKITINMIADCKYIMERNDFNITINCKSLTGNSKADYAIEDVANYQEPLEQFATISYIPEKKSELNPFISRVDDMVPTNSGDIFGACNYSIPVDFKYFSGANGELNLKVSEGRHKIEYLILGRLVFDGLVQIDTIDFKAGKNYTILLEEKKAKRNISYAIKFVEK